jgi:hypothetical protein
MHLLEKMLMKPGIQLAIATPCHENWNAMSPADQGRFCNACAKQVIDFSTRTDQQILYYLSHASGSICGRLSDHQMSRPLVPAAEQPKTKWWWTLLMPLLMVFDKAAAQKRTAPAIKGQVAATHATASPDEVIITGYTSVSRPKPTIAAQQYSISGTVTDEKGKPVSGALVRAEEWRRETITDSTGAYHLRLTTQTYSYTDTVHVNASFIGYKAAGKPVRPAEAAVINLVLTGDTYVLNEVVVAGYQNRICRTRMGSVSFISTEVKSGKDTALAAVRKVRDLLQVAGSAVSVYPNPVRHGQQLTVTAKGVEDYTIEILSGSGQLLFTQVYTAKEMKPEIPIPAHWAGGLYFVRLVNEKNKKQYTEKIVVQ